MAWAKTDQADVLTAIQARLKTQLGLNDSTCFLTLHPVPPKTSAVVQNEFVTICLADSEFNGQVFEGAGEEHVEENSGVIVTAFTRMRLDRNEHSTQLLTNTTRGLLKVWKKNILAALSGHDLLDTSGNSILDNLLQPVRCNAPDTGEEDLAGVSITFEIDFDWNL